MDITFCNFERFPCGCRADLNDGGGEYAHVVRVHLCDKHSPASNPSVDAKDKHVRVSGDRWVPFVPPPVIDEHYRSKEVTVDQFNNMYPFLYEDCIPVLWDSQENPGTKAVVLMAKGNPSEDIYATDDDDDEINNGGKV